MHSVISVFLDRYEATKDLNMMITVDPYRLKEHAERQASVRGPLSGKLVVVKDNIHVAGLPNTCGSRFLKDYIAPYHATAVERIINAGGIIAGKTNMDEFAMGSSTEYSAMGPVKNPADPEYVPGGSSGGSAAAVAAGLTDYALGSDTGGSIRQPASFCGVTGLKPTYGRVSRYGLTAFASSLDQIGPITRSVRQSAELLQVIAGRDEKDATSSDTGTEDYVQALDKDDTRTIGIPRHLLEEGLHPGVAGQFNRAVDILKKNGKKVVEIELPHLKYSIAVYYILATAEASSNLARFDGVRYGARNAENAETIDDFYAGNREYGFGPEVKRRIMLGTYVLSSGYYDAYYARAQKVRRLIYGDFRKAFAKVDCILLPTAPNPPFRLGEHLNDPMAMYLSDIFTVSVNIAGIPGLSVPAGKTRDGLPVGIQVLGDLYRESSVLQLGNTLEALL